MFNKTEGDVEERGFTIETLQGKMETNFPTTRKRQLTHGLSSDSSDKILTMTTLRITTRGVWEFLWQYPANPQLRLKIFIALCASSCNISSFHTSRDLQCGITRKKKKWAHKILIDPTLIELPLYSFPNHPGKC